MEEQAESPEKVEKKKGTRIGLVPGLIIIAVATAVVIFLLLPSHRYSGFSRGFINHPLRPILVLAGEESKRKIRGIPYR